MTRYHRTQREESRGRRRRVSISDNQLQRVLNRVQAQMYDQQANAMMEGGEEEGLRPPDTLSEKHLNFLNGTDEVPEDLFARLWGLFTRMNQLTNIHNEIEMDRVRTLTRTITRPMQWAGDITFEQERQIVRFVELQIQKSFKQGERRLLASHLQEIRRVEESAERFQTRGGSGAFGGIRGLFGR